VQVTGTQGNWQLRLNGQPYFIKGAGYGPDLSIDSQATTNAYVADLVATGANTTRTWGLSVDTAKLLTAANLNSAHVILGFWLNHGTNYCGTTNADTNYMNDAQNSLLDWVNAYKNDPAVLMWDIGNEVILDTPANGVRVCYAQYVNRLSQLIHVIDPNHPTTSTEATPVFWPYYAANAPDLDLLAVNQYGAIVGLQNAWALGAFGERPRLHETVHRHRVRTFRGVGGSQRLQRSAHGAHRSAEGGRLLECVGVHHRLQRKRGGRGLAGRHRIHLRELQRLPGHRHTHAVHGHVVQRRVHVFNDEAAVLLRSEAGVHGCGADGEPAPGMPGHDRDPVGRHRDRAPVHGHHKLRRSQRRSHDVQGHDQQQVHRPEQHRFVRCHLLSERRADVQGHGTQSRRGVEDLRLCLRRSQQRGDRDRIVRRHRGRHAHHDAHAHIHADADRDTHPACHNRRHPHRPLAFSP